MLRNVEKKRIFQEEVYRYELRSQLNKPDTKKNTGGKIWTAVNSAFFLWFLSSVVVGVISFSYARWDKQREIEREQRERASIIEQENIQRARKLDAEISSRLTYFFYSQKIPKNIIETVTETAVNEVIVEVPKGDPRLSKGPVTETEVPEAKANSSHVEDDSGETVDDIIPLSKDAIMSLYRLNDSKYKSGDPEFANRSLHSLLVDLESVVPLQEKNEISLAIDRFIKLQRAFVIALRKIEEPENEGKPGNVRINAQTFNEFCESANLKRWPGVEIPPVTITTNTETDVAENIIYQAAQSNNGKHQTPRKRASHVR